MEITDQSFNIVDIKPANMEELTEVITASEFHPKECNHFVYSSSKGTIRLCDMRQAALCDNHAKRESIFNFLQKRRRRAKRVYNFSSDKIDRCIGLMKHFQSKHFFPPIYSVNFSLLFSLRGARRSNESQLLFRNNLIHIGRQVFQLWSVHDLA